jgi:hypothetical protein
VLVEHNDIAVNIGGPKLDNVSAADTSVEQERERQPLAGADDGVVCSFRPLSPAAANARFW